MEQQNPDEVFCEGRNEEEALQAACDRLDTTPNQVEYEVVESVAGGGMLGFLKGRAVRIRVWKKPETQRRLNELIKGLCDAFDMGLTFQVARIEDGYEVVFETEGSDGLLIGRGGETLAALQHLISRMASRMDEALHVRVDVAGYRRRRQDQLRRSARDLAERALGSGREMVTEPLPADERRVVHLTLAEDPRVETRAIGEGLTKRVAVVPSGSAGGSGAAPRAEGPGSGPRPRGRGGRSGRDGRHREGRADDGRGRGGRSHGGRPGPTGSGEARPLPARSRPPEDQPRQDRPEPVREARPDRSDQPREPRPERSERASEPRRDSFDRPRRHEPRRETSEPEETVVVREEARTAPEPERSRPVPEKVVAEPPQEEQQDSSYFRIPERIGLVTPAPEKKRAGEESEDTEEKPVTFGRRPRAARRRGR
jgi:spoIIIJ-associated protein